jgi:uncharacterized protein (TIGR03067 family)
MALRCVFGIALALAVAANAAPAEDPKAEPQKLQGVWKVVAFEAKGIKVPQPPLAEIVISADTYTMKSRKPDDKPVALAYTADATQTPKTIDLFPPKGKAGKSWKGIYAIEGDELKICLPVVKKGDEPSDVRPDRFGSEDKLWMVIVAKRGKP